MIFNFKKIRKQLWFSEKRGKYFTYAVSEILLIMIGIVLAFQINNWKEKSDNQKIEKELIANIWYGLQGDLIDIKANNEAHARFLKNQVSSINWLESKKGMTDSVTGYFSIAHKATAFLISKAPFETLKEFGLNRISNDTLRLNIIYLYDVSL